MGNLVKTYNQFILENDKNNQLKIKNNVFKCEAKLKALLPKTVEINIYKNTIIQIDFYGNESFIKHKNKDLTHTVNWDIKRGKVDALTYYEDYDEEYDEDDHTERGYDDEHCQLYLKNVYDDAKKVYDFIVKYANNECDDPM